MGDKIKIWKNYIRSYTIYIKLQYRLIRTPSHTTVEKMQLDQEDIKLVECMMYYMQ